MTDSPASPQSTPPSSAPAPAPAPATEVAVNHDPVSTPSPVGSQAPEKPPAEPQKPPSRREAIQNALNKAKEQQAAGDKKPGERPRSLPPQKPVEPAGPQPYREQGRFARDPGQLQPEAGQPPPQQQPQVRHPPLHETAPFRDAPPRFADNAKQDWNGTPESVRGAVYQMAREFQGAYEKYRGDSETMEPIRHFHQLATQQGTTLQRALTNYVGMEQKLRSDLVGGLDMIVNNMNLKTSSGQKVTLRDVAYHILNMSPDQHRMTSQQNAQQSQTMQIGQLHQTVEGLTDTVKQLIYNSRFKDTRSQVDQFADNHPGFDDLTDLIQIELQHGYGLEDAYHRAAMFRPDVIRAAQTRTHSAQTRDEDRSISGAPDTGPSDGRARRGNGKPPTRREAIARALKRVNGSV